MRSKVAQYFIEVLGFPKEEIEQYTDIKLIAMMSPRMYRKFRNWLFKSY